MHLESIYKIYETGKVEALNNITLDFKLGKLYAIMGHSGSGKSTLINILGMLDNITKGKYLFLNQNVSELKEEEKAQIRNEKIGFVFQSYYLDYNLTALENVILPSLKSKKISKQEREIRGKELLKKFGLEERINHKPSELSGGECGRVALARSLMNNPDFIIADEPTGNLDQKNEKIVFQYLKEISKQGKCVIVVSHNAEIKKYCDQIYYLENGELK